MAQESSFDVVSVVDLQEVDNAVNQVQKEMALRYDFKGTANSVDFNRTEKKITLVASDEMKLKALHDMLTLRFAKRGISPKALKFGDEEKAFGGSLRQGIEVRQGISQEHAREIVRLIKETKLKVQARIQGEEIRISGKQRDDLQAAINCLKNSKIDIPLQFVNYR
ncbi:MAG TPA: YajQ family cyclic di-GMP-binding protein [Candidatus Omnitrophota bacterium]|nr:YajQ family cyclic di-GMP-binding protein [Candidatus Omnitrophota bacterium]